MEIHKLLSLAFMFDFYMHLEIEEGYAIMKFDEKTVTLLEYDGEGWDSITHTRKAFNTLLVNDTLDILDNDIIKAVFVGEG